MHLSDKLLNTCKTKIGKREFKRLLLNPTRDIHYLKESYDMIEYCVHKNYNTSDYLTKLCDIEKINRKIILEKATPHEYFLLHETCNTLLGCFNNFDLKFNNYICSKNTILDINKILEITKQTFYIQNAKNVNELDETCDNLICHGIDIELDEATRKKMESKSKFKKRS